MTAPTAQGAVIAELRAENLDLREQLDRKLMQISVLNKEIAVMRAMQNLVDAKGPPRQYLLHR